MERLTYGPHIESFSMYPNWKNAIGRFLRFSQSNRLSIFSREKKQIDEGISCIAVPIRHRYFIESGISGNSLIFEQSERSRFSKDVKCLILGKLLIFIQRANSNE